MSWRRLQDVFAIRLLKTSSRGLAILSWRRLGRQKNVTLKTLYDVFSTSPPGQMFATCVPNKTEDLNLSFFNLITGINELKTLTKAYFMRMWMKICCKNM